MQRDNFLNIFVSFIACSQYHQSVCSILFCCSDRSYYYRICHFLSGINQGNWENVSSDIFVTVTGLILVCAIWIKLGSVYPPALLLNSLICSLDGNCLFHCILPRSDPFNGAFSFVSLIFGSKNAAPLHGKIQAWGWCSSPSRIYPFFHLKDGVFQFSTCAMTFLWELFSSLP